MIKITIWHMRIILENIYFRHPHINGRDKCLGVDMFGKM